MWEVVFLIGRIALALLFLISASNKFVALGDTASYIASKGLPAATFLATLSAMVEAAFGLMVAAGFKTRIAALGLAAFTVLATLFFHDFWNMAGPDRAANVIQLEKNVAIIGALLMLAVVGGRQLSLDRAYKEADLS
jgi:putative oxidoreductase